MKKRLRPVVLLAALLAALVGLAALRQALQLREDAAQARGETVYADPVAANHPLLLQFQAAHPEAEVVLACAGDITDDGEDDLAVIYRSGEDMSAVVLTGGVSGVETDPIPAPRENQKLRFFNMDGAGAAELLITGEKNGQVGYAVYRLSDGRLKDLFGEGMKDCC